MHLEAVDFKLSTLLSDSLKHVEAQTREKNLSLTLEADVAVAKSVAVGDPFRLKQFLTNLLR